MIHTIMNIYYCFDSMTDLEFARFVVSKNKASSKRLFINVVPSLSLADFCIYSLQMLRTITLRA